VKYRKHKKTNRGAAQNGKGEKNNNNTNSVSNNSNNNNSNPTTNMNLSSLTLSNSSINTNNSNGQSQQNNSRDGSRDGNSNTMLPPHPGNILMQALTSPNEGIPRRREHVMPFDQAANMINALVQCDNFHDIAALHVSVMLHYYSLFLCTNHYHISLAEEISHWDVRCSVGVVWANESFDPVRKKNELRKR
jgi:hypothetical protein